MSAAIQQTADDPGFRKYLGDIGFDLVGSSPEQFRAEFQVEQEVIPQLIRSLGVVPK